MCSNKITYIIAAGFLLLMLGLAITSIKDDSLIMDEVAHLPAGYSYLTHQDMRLNPEHPPLLKDLAAFPLLFIKNINFPSDIKAWQQGTNNQWDFGFYFLYHMGNPVDQMIFWGRMPMLFVLLLLGFYVFKWTKELFGNNAALLATFFYSFSPTLIAHGRFVTTDVGAAAGAFIATYYFIKALKSPTWKNIIISGLVFGIAEMLKFSLILLVPLFLFTAFVWWIIKSGTFLATLKTFLFVMVIGVLLIWPVYQFHTWNYPPERQVKDTAFNLGGYIPSIRNPVVWMADKPILRPYAQYLTGLLMVFNRVAGGNTTFFLGEVSNRSWKNYFPVLYAIKEPLAFHILTIISLLYLAWQIKKRFWHDTFNRIRNWLKAHFPEFAMVSFVGLYWLVSLTGNLNIGVRHLLPVFPFTILLVAATTSSWLKEPHLQIKYGFVGLLIGWQAISVFSVYPHFLAYFNELVGGPDKGYIYAADSNLDWGQDLKRLSVWVEDNKVDKIYLDYFGGGDPQYYLGEKFAPWWGNRNPAELPKGSYLAVSATFLQGGRAQAAPGFNQPTNYYFWLDKYKPIAKIGYSIFIYKIN